MCRYVVFLQAWSHLLNPQPCCTITSFQLVKHVQIFLVFVYLYKVNVPTKMDQVHGHIKFDIFQTCYIILSAEAIAVKFSPSKTNLIGNILQLTKVNIVHRTQDIYHFVIIYILCQLGPFLLAQSHICVYACMYIIICIMHMFVCICTHIVVMPYICIMVKSFIM